MKARPRRIENQVAALLNDVYVKLGLSKVERIPVLGRTGPDISVNEMGLAVDVKSRISIPELYYLEKGETSVFIGAEEYYGTRLGELDFFRVMGEGNTSIKRKSSIVVERWLDHICEWNTDCVGALVLHWPRTRLVNSIFLTRLEDWRVLVGRAKQLSNL